MCLPGWPSCAQRPPEHLTACPSLRPKLLRPLKGNVCVFLFEEESRLVQVSKLRPGEATTASFPELKRISRTENEKELERSCGSIPSFYLVFLKFLRDKSLRPRNLNDFPKVSQLVDGLARTKAPGLPAAHCNFLLPKPKPVFLCVSSSSPSSSF